MKPLISLAIAFLPPLVAQAAVSTDAVLKDTRQFDVYIASITGAPGCMMPADTGTPVAGECVVTKERYVADGELITRDAVSGLCTSSIWRQIDRPRLTYDRFDASAPSLSVSQRVYKCGADGLPVAGG